MAVMNLRDPRIWTAVAIVLTMACTSGPGPVDDGSYIEDLVRTRADKNLMLRTEKDSPIPEAERATFPGLPYFDIKPEFRVPAVLTEQRGGAPVVIEMQQTDGQTARMRKVGALGFTLGSAKYALTAFAEMNDTTMERLFVPFGDLTNGADTYKGGRFLNLKRTATGLYDLDFNQAFHPYCVYNPTWICPVPPRENRLAVAIPAGERLNGAHK
jgi:uncharacterized protein (DUF1684 family)